MSTRGAEEAERGDGKTTYSPAETLLWLSDHLANIRKPTKLRYDFKKTGTLEEGFQDAVELDVVKLHPDGMKNAQVIFFTGARRQAVPPSDHISGNPVLGVYLQGDINEMSRLTEGGWPYFQRRIKFAFADPAGVQPITRDHRGRKVEGKKIEITPYVKDPKRSLFEKFSGKRYEFILSDQIPGTLYQIHTLVPDNARPTEHAAALIEETPDFCRG